MLTGGPGQHGQPRVFLKKARVRRERGRWQKPGPAIAVQAEIALAECGSRYPSNGLGSAVWGCCRLDRCPGWGGCWWGRQGNEAGHDEAEVWVDVAGAGGLKGAMHSFAFEFAEAGFKRDILDDSFQDRAPQKFGENKLVGHCRNLLLHEQSRRESRCCIDSRESYYRIIKDDKHFRYESHLGAVLQSFVSARERGEKGKLLNFTHWLQAAAQACKTWQGHGWI